MHAAAPDAPPTVRRFGAQQLVDLVENDALEGVGQVDPVVR